MGFQGDSQGRVIDPAAIEQLRALQGADEPDVLAELVEMYLADTEPRIVELRAAVGEGRLEDAGRAAHALAGGSAVFGAEPLISVCRQLQAAAREGDGASAPALVERLQEEYDRLRNALRREIATDA